MQKGPPIKPGSQLSLMMVTKSGRPVQLQPGISQGIGNTEVAQGGSNAANQHLLLGGSRDDEAANANIITGPNMHSRREVERLCPWRGGSSR